MCWKLPLLHDGGLFGMDASYFNLKKSNLSFPHELSRVSKMAKGLCQWYRKMVMLLLAYFISNQFGTFITQGHYHKLCFVLADYAVD